MGFASSWLEERALYPQLINEAPRADTGIIAVIPSYDEPEITRLLDSLYVCTRPDCGTELIFVINAPEEAGEEALANNLKTIKDIDAWLKHHHDCFFSVHVIDITPRIHGKWSVGMARKTGMDEAVRRFDMLDRPEGIILSLDADCEVQSNYFTSVYMEMHGRNERQACSIYFEHPVKGDDFGEEIYKSIIQYELHLRYYFQALAFTGFPYVHHTIGSAIAVKALPYVRSGGMNRRMAGEDFYFIQKLVPAGGYFNLYSTTVYPSPRSSSRVPFGTGVTISKMAASDKGILLTYDLRAFLELKTLFGMIDQIYSYEKDDNLFFFADLPVGLRTTTGIQEWSKRIMEIRANTSGLISFRKRFFNWFNMFRIVKYLNAVHIDVFGKRPVYDCASELLAEKGINFNSTEPEELLEYFRGLEKQY